MSIFQCFALKRRSIITPRRDIKPLLAPAVCGPSIHFHQQPIHYHLHLINVNANAWMLHLNSYLNAVGFTVTLGPIVEEIATFFKYTPLAAAGLALFSASSRDLRFSLSFSASKDALPIGA
jgi:hypothetical protein